MNSTDCRAVELRLPENDSDKRPNLNAKKHPFSGGVTFLASDPPIEKERECVDHRETLRILSENFTKTQFAEVREKDELELAND
jgi:hypothetical protein